MLPHPTPRYRQSSPCPHPVPPPLRRPGHSRAGRCLAGKSCRRADRSGRRAPPSPCDTASSEGSGSFQVLPGSSPITVSLPSSKAHQKSGSFPPPALPGFSGTMTLSDTHLCRRLSAPLRPLPSPMMGLPRLPASPSQRAVPTTPADRDGCTCRLLPRSRGLPRYAGGSASASSLSRPAQASLTLRPAGSQPPEAALSRGFDPTSYPAEPLVSYQINRQLSGWNLPPLVTRAVGAHGIISSRCPQTANSGQTLPGTRSRRIRRCLPLPIVALHRSALGDVDDRFGEGPRRLLRQVVADAAGDHPVLVPARELPGVGARLRVRRAVGVALEGDGRHGDGRRRREPLLEVVVPRLPLGEAEPPAVV